MLVGKYNRKSKGRDDNASGDEDGYLHESITRLNRLREATVDEVRNGRKKVENQHKHQPPCAVWWW